MYIRTFKQEGRTYYYLMGKLEGESKNGYRRYLGTADRIFRDLEELDTLRKQRIPRTNVCIDFSENTVPSLVREQHYPEIGRMYREIMQQKRKKGKEVAQFIRRHMNRVNLGTALNYVSALRKGDIYQSPSRTGKRVDSLDKYIRRMVCALKACEVDSSHLIIMELQKIEPRFMEFWNSKQGSHGKNWHSSLEEITEQTVSSKE